MPKLLRFFQICRPKQVISLVLSFFPVNNMKMKILYHHLSRCTDQKRSLTLDILIQNPKDWAANSSNLEILRAQTNQRFF